MCSEVKWVAHLYDCIARNACIHCAQPFARCFAFSSSLFFPCCEKPKCATHCFPMLLHEECVDAFGAEYIRKKRNLLYTCIGKPTTTLEPKERTAYGDQCLAYHKVMLAKCAACGQHQQEHVQFYNCSKCHCVTYCDAECQLEHWPEHKKTCGKLLETKQQRFVTSFCSCMSEMDRDICTRTREGICSLPGCTREAKVLDERSVVFSWNCSKKSRRRKRVLHKNTLAFCSIMCQKNIWAAMEANAKLS
jgi:hypothetical protein